jgi:hypothetical protein
LSLSSSPRRPVHNSSISNSATFRISTENLNLLRKESEGKQVSLNTLVNQVIKEHLDWHCMAASAKLYYLPKSFLVRLIHQLTEEQLSELARDTAKNDLVDICLFLRGEFSIASLSNITETWLRITKMPYRFEINANNSKIIIEHDMGYKYSFLIREIARYIMEVGFEARTSCDFTDNTVIIKLNQ